MREGTEERGRSRVVPTEFPSGGETLRGDFVIPFEGKAHPGICKFHGLPGSRDQVGGVATRLSAAGFAVLTFDFRGFRRSGGLFSLAKAVEDARNAVSHLLKTKHVLKGWVGVYGASYGGAIAMLAAARDPRISALCLRAPVYDTEAFARSALIQPEVDHLAKNFPEVMHGLTDPLTRRKIVEEMGEDAKILNPIREIHRLAPRPLLVITGDADTAIPLEGVRCFYKRAKEPKHLVVIENADHELTTPNTFEETMKRVVAWFRQQKPTHVPLETR